VLLALCRGIPGFVDSGTGGLLVVVVAGGTEDDL
jgi:hypothetical protein